MYTLFLFSCCVSEDMCGNRDHVMKLLEMYCTGIKMSGSGLCLQKNSSKNKEVFRVEGVLMGKQQMLNRLVSCGSYFFKRM